MRTMANILEGLEEMRFNSSINKRKAEIPTHLVAVGIASSFLSAAQRTLRDARGVEEVVPSVDAAVGAIDLHIKKMAAGEQYAVEDVIHKYEPRIGRIR